MSQFDALALIVPCFVSGNAATGNVLSFVAPFDVEILGVSLVAGTAPTGAALLAQVTVAGSNAYSNGARPTIAISGTQGTAGVPDTISKASKGQLVAVNVAQVGSTVAGANVSYVLTLRKS